MLSNERSPQVCPVVAAKQIRSAKLGDGFDRWDPVANHGIEDTEFGDSPITEIRLPQEFILPPEVNVEAKILGELAVCNTDVEFAFRCVKSGAECATVCLLRVKRGVVVVSIIFNAIRPVQNS